MSAPSTPGSEGRVRKHLARKSNVRQALSDEESDAQKSPLRPNDAAPGNANINSGQHSSNGVVAHESKDNEEINEAERGGISLESRKSSSGGKSEETPERSGKFGSKRSSRAIVYAVMGKSSAKMNLKLSDMSQSNTSPDESLQSGRSSARNSARGSSRSPRMPVMNPKVSDTRFKSAENLEAFKPAIEGERAQTEQVPLSRPENPTGHLRIFGGAAGKGAAKVWSDMSALSARTRASIVVDAPIQSNVPTMTRDMEKIVAEFSSKIFDHRNILKFKSMLVDPEHLQVFVDVGRYNSIKNLISHLDDIHESSAQAESSIIAILSVLKKAFASDKIFKRVVVEDAEAVKRILFSARLPFVAIKASVYSLLVTIWKLATETHRFTDWPFYSVLVDAFDYYFYKTTEAKRYDHLVHVFQHESDVTKVAVLRIVNFLVRGNPELSDRMGLMNHLGTLGLERVLYMSKETASITLIEEIANYNELLVRTRNAWDASMRKAVKLSLDININDQAMIYKVCLELIKRVGQNERNALGFYNILLSLLKLPVDDFDGLDRWLLLEHFVHHLSEKKSTIVLTEKQTIDIRKIVEKTLKTSRRSKRSGDGGVDISNAADFTATIIKLDADLRASRKHLEEMSARKDAVIAKLSEDIEMLLGDDTKDEERAQHLKEIDSLREQVGDLKDKLKTAVKVESTTSKKDEERIRELELKAEQLRTEALKVPNLEAAVEHLKSERGHANEVVKELEKEVKAGREEIAALKNELVCFKEKEQTGHAAMMENDAVLANILLKESQAANEMLREELIKEQQALEDERKRRKDREANIVQFNEVILKMQKSIAASHETLKKEHETELKKISDELLKRVAEFQQRLKEEKASHEETRKKLAEVQPK